MQADANRSSWRETLLLFVMISLFFAIGLGARPYLTPSEARYIEIPRQMLATGDWLTPRINGVPYFEKPPLFYWMQASAMELFGSNEFSGRIVTLLLTSLTCLIAYATAGMLYGWLGGLFAALVLATSLLGYGLSRVAMLDVPVSCFLTACLSCFLAAQQTANPATRRNYYLLMYVAAALATMSKGLIGIVIPGLVIGAWIVCTKRWHILKQAKLIPGLLIFLVITAPWHVLMAQKHPDFLSFYFIHEHFTRFVSDEHKRTAPWWFFIAVTLGGLLPWTGLLPVTYKRLQVKEPVTLFLLLWIVLPLLFFSSSHSKLVPYIFPIFPPLAILLGRTLADLWTGKLSNKSLSLTALLTVIVLGIALVSIPLLPSLPGKAGQKLAILAGIPPLMLSPIALALLCLAYVAWRKRTTPALIMVLTLVSVSIGMTSNYLAARLDTSTIRPLAQMLKPHLHNGDSVVAYGSYWQDLPVYLDRNVTVVDWTGELGFGVTHYPETRAWMIPSAEFWLRCATTAHRMYVFIPEELSKIQPPPGCQLHQLAKYGKTVLMESVQQ